MAGQDHAVSVRQQPDRYFYILQKVRGAEKAKGTIADLIKAFNVVPLTVNDCADALALPMNDFEDVLIVVCAQKVEAEFIISRDKKFINAGTAVKVITPSELIKKVNGI